MIETAPGRSEAWNLLRKLGEGDAGEVFLVESLLERKRAVLKRPQKSTFTSDTIRQSSQIEREAKVLSALATIDLESSPIQVPQLLDQAKNGTELTDRYFIVISEAQGYDLNFLARLIHIGELDKIATSYIEQKTSGYNERAYLEYLARKGEYPRLVILRALYETLQFLNIIHKFETPIENSHHFGVIWNDIKPEHMLWDPIQSRFTFIDWGNAQFLGPDGVTSDLQYSRFNDLKQFISEMGGFITNTLPDLFEDLNWPETFSPIESFDMLFEDLTKIVGKLITKELASLQATRKEEARLIKIQRPSIKHQIRLLEIQDNLVSAGEIPDYLGAQKFFSSLARGFLDSGEMENLLELSKELSSNSVSESRKWSVIEKITIYAQNEALFNEALKSALVDDWLTVLWELRCLAITEPTIEWWEEIHPQVREEHLGSNFRSITPVVAINRLIHALKDISLQPDHEFQSSGDSSEQFENSSNNPYEELANKLKNTTLQRWRQLEPDPPNSGIDYLEIERSYSEISKLMPDFSKTLIQALEQPNAQVKIALDAWENKDFATAQLALRHLLMWDPDRLRHLSANQAMQFANQWLEAIRKGPKSNEPLQDFVTRLELQGRELRNQVSSSSWLDNLLEALADLRKGIEPTEVLVKHSQIRQELQWLTDFQSEIPIIDFSSAPVILEREVKPTNAKTLRGILESRFGPGENFHLTTPLDTWVPEARGSSARVFLGTLPTKGNPEVKAAIKLMRPDRAEYALPLFREEAQVLAMMRDVPGVVQLLEAGYLQLDSGSHVPEEDQSESAENLGGHVDRFGTDAVQNFLLELNNRVEEGWVPYLASEIQPKIGNLLLLCDTGYTGGRFLPIMEGLRIPIQICDILESAHNRNIVYRDHKILHYYWKGEYNGVFLIDWNIARRFPEGLPESEMQFDLVQFGARTLHHILTGRPAPGALPLGSTRPEDIEAAAHSYSVRWTYDDQRLPKDLREILRKVLSGEYTMAKQLRLDLLSIFQSFSELFTKE